MYIDNSIVEQARNTDMVDFLSKRNGFTFVRQGDTYRCKQHPSLAVKDDRLSFFWHSKGIGGHGVLDYLIKIENMTFRDAVQSLSGAVQPTAPPQRMEVRKKTLELPEKTGIPIRLYDYLCKKRGIDPDIVNTLIHRGMLYEDRRGNVVFVGFDEQGKPRFASLRGTRGDYRGDCAGSDKRYGFSVSFPNTDQLYIYESPIDLMSMASIENDFRGSGEAWKSRSRLSLSGTTDTAIPFFLNQHKEVKELVFALDNDPAGREASNSLSRKYAEKGYFVRIEPPYRKDWNEDLQALRAQTQALKRAKHTQRDVEI